MEKIAELFLQAGGHWGLIVAALIWALRETDRRYQQALRDRDLAVSQAQTNERTEHERRLEDQRTFTRTLLDLSQQVFAAIESLEDRK